MPPAATHWDRIAGEGLIWAGPCTVKAIIFWPHASSQYVDIYDGRDITSGTKFCRIDAFQLTTRHIGMGNGVEFGRGIYVNAEHDEDETTVIFTPLDV